MNKLTLKLVSESFSVYKIKVNKLEINSDLKDYWTNFVPNSVASFKKVLLRVSLNDKSNKQKQTYYLILNNIFMFYVDNQIELRYSDSDLVLYTYTKNHQDYFKKINNELKVLKNEINLSKAFKENNIYTENDIRNIYKERELFKLEAISNFSLIKGEEWNIEKD